jgi:hypothetical protein
MEEGTAARWLKKHSTSLEKPALAHAAAVRTRLPCALALAIADCSARGLSATEIDRHRCTVAIDLTLAIAVDLTLAIVVDLTLAIAGCSWHSATAPKTTS